MWHGSLRATSRVVTPLELTGRACGHVRLFEIAGDDSFVAHPEAGEAFLRLCAAAKCAGFDPQPVSVYRDFAGQCRIWDAKWRGERPLYDRDGGILAAEDFCPEARVRTILLWSALPGASRHHWGTEFDVIDRATLLDGYRLRLMPDEFAPGGVFAALGTWLDVHAAEFGFFRPYDIDRGGAQPEPWHLSYAQVSVPALAAMDVRCVREAVETGSVEGQTEILEQLEALFPRFIMNVGQPVGLASPTLADRGK